MQPRIPLTKIVGPEQILETEVVNFVVEAVLRLWDGLSHPQQPTSSFLFLGPTGVSKTELAKALTEQLFDDENLLVRIDMSEYMDQHSVPHLIRAPPSYVGHEEGGKLAEQVRRWPYNVIPYHHTPSGSSDMMTESSSEERGRPRWHRGSKRDGSGSGPSLRWSRSDLPRVPDLSVWG
ncbi:hypothetical protein GUJ93_ZPchr0006g40637 [Zizania palustris]|uniref:ATPase AAA-type core domain-containing protein n=1 Tax=Zizania palustris TaxID=103762 RepID=A0A8J5VGH7_ZIZPA|nr:hypothetical protein GUJ93_ZPchr0006g40637 [Zizania palustris]